jgi:hypothetical protein
MGCLNYLNITEVIRKLLFDGVGNGEIEYSICTNPTTIFYFSIKLKPKQLY